MRVRLLSQPATHPEMRGGGGIGGALFKLLKFGRIYFSGFGK